MFSLLGTTASWVALVGAGWLVVRGVAAARTDEAAGRVDLGMPVRLVVGGAVAAMLALEGAILANDFSVSYVADNHSVFTPFPFNVATAWAALEGSIVLWGLVQAGFIWFTFRAVRRRPDRLGAGAMAVLGIVGLFFFGMIVTVSNPFQVCVEAAANSCAVASPFPWAAASAPANGAGPNPLLQNHILMAVHPPLLYLGYVGMSVPFAYAMSALAIGVPGAEWLRRSHRSTLVAWSFLTLGIVLGGWWAYEVLSWGGYWAWDPVENASFMPWLVATAFLHSALVQKRRGMLQAWNFVLVIAAFGLTILGTFLTRSGTIASVHSFTQSPVGPVLLGFLVLTLAGSFALFAARAELVAGAPRLDSLSSREGAFLLNNLLLTVFAFVVLVGTLYPMFLEAFSDQTVGVGRPFFDRLALPLSFALLLAMGIGPVMPWRVARPGLVWKRIHPPLQFALAVGALTVLVSSRIGWVVGAVVTGSFVIAVIVRHLWEQAGRGAAGRGTGRWQETKRLFATDPGYWGGQVSHAGVAIVAVAIAFASNLAVHNRVRMQPGDTVSFAGYELTYVSPFLQNRPEREIQGARIRVSEDGEILTEMEPRVNVIRGSAIGTPAVYTRLGGDLYLTLRTIGPDGIDLEMNTSPLQWLLWVGGLLTAAGGFIALQGRRRTRRSVREVSAGV